MIGPLVALLSVVALLAVLAGTHRSANDRIAVTATVVLGGGLLLLDLTGPAVLVDVAAPLGEIRLVSFLGDDPLTRLAGLVALAWCGPPADQVVRGILALTGIRLGRDVDQEDVRTGRWLGRLERVFILIVVVAGQPALTAIPVGGKALFRYAETMADARADPGGSPRHVLLEYVIIGSFASWGQAVLLALVVLGRTNA